MKPKILNQLLIEHDYPEDKRRYIVHRFDNGFNLHFEENRLVKHTAPNLRLRIDSKKDLWNKVMKEVEKSRYAGPYENPPYEYFIQSPIGLVQKDQGKDTRLIFHLSYPRSGDSVNSATPVDKCSVKYPDINKAV